MELKPGYKQTEVDAVPAAWEVRTLGSLTSLLTNGFVGTATSAYVDNDDGVLYIQGYNIQENGFNFHGIKRVSKSFHDRNQKSCLQPGDLLTIQTGDIGVTAVVPPALAGSNCHALVISRLDKRVSEPSFYCQYFNSERGRVAFKEIETGSTMKHLNVGDMKRLFLPSPPIEEQRAIAGALGDVDALLGALTQLIAKKRDLKHAAMRHLITGQHRLPGFQGEWDLKRLADLGTWKGGATPSMQDSSYWREGTVPWISSGDVKSVLLRETGFSITAFAVKQGTTTLLPANSIVVVTRSGILRKYLPVAMNVMPMAINQDIKALIPTDKVEPLYVLQALIGNGDRILARCLKSGTTVESIEFRWLKAWTIPLPPIDEQRAIAAVLSDMDAEITALEARRDKTRALKQGMMQELLTGRIRLV